MTNLFEKKHRAGNTDFVLDVWQDSDGKVYFNAVPLTPMEAAELTARINTAIFAHLPSNRKPVVLGDPALGNERVVGGYPVDPGEDPTPFPGHSISTEQFADGKGLGCNLCDARGAELAHPCKPRTTGDASGCGHDHV